MGILQSFINCPELAYTCGFREFISMAFGPISTSASSSATSPNTLYFSAQIGSANHHCIWCHSIEHPAIIAPHSTPSPTSIGAFISTNKPSKITYYNMRLYNINCSLLCIICGLRYRHTAAHFLSRHTRRCCSV